MIGIGDARLLLLDADLSFKLFAIRSNSDIIDCNCCNCRRFSVT